MIQEFFENKEIFVTGGSGIVGKAVIEKLLRSCNVGKIYILLRPKKIDSIEKRLGKIKQEVIFSRLRQEKPDELDKKLMCIPGDAISPFLGITSESHKLLENVSVIIHCAATVRFDEPLCDALRLNVGGTLEMLKFAETLKHLEVVLHVSTFFSNPYLTRVEDKVYDSPMDWKFCLNLLERNDISEEQLDIITRKLIVGFPNTYCFTKNLTECMVNDYRNKLPVGIYRPSVVVFALEEPEAGFPPSMMGATGLSVVAGAGLLKAVYMGKDNKLDLTPQDIAAKCLCYYTVKTANLYKSQQKPTQAPVFMTSSCTHTVLSYKQGIKEMENHGIWTETAFEKNFLIPGVYFSDNRLVYLFMVALKQIVPALLGDLALILSGHKPALMRAQRKLYGTLEVMKAFTFNNYDSTGTTDSQEMVDRLKGTDFNLDIEKRLKSCYSHIEFLHPIGYTIRRYLLKEDPKTLPRSRKILKAKIFMYNTLKLYLAFKVWEKFLAYSTYFYTEHLLGNGNSTSFAEMYN